MKRRWLKATSHHVMALLAVALLALSGEQHSAVARDQPGLRACYGVVTFGRENPDIHLMQVITKAERLPFYRNRTEKTPHCPVEVDSCQLTAFVVPGDWLLAGPAMEDFVCATYVSANARPGNGQIRQTTGFVPRAELREVKDAAAWTSDWSGLWSGAAQAEIHIRATESGRFRITGKTGERADDAACDRQGAVKTCGFDSVVEIPRTGMMALGEGYDGTTPLGVDRSVCRARLRRLGPYLVVEDNGGCGAKGVSFTGIYLRLKPH